MKLGIDIDGCLANFTKGFGHALIKHTGEGNKLPEDWETSPEFPATWNWHYDAGYSKEACDKVWKSVVEGKGFWLNLEPLPGAPEAIRGLNRLAKAGHDVYFLTHRSGKLAKAQTEEWLGAYGMDNPTVLLTGNKLPIFLALGLDYFIDDKLETVNEVQRYVTDNRLYRSVFIKDAPYNRQGRHLNLRVASSVEDALRQAELWQEPRRGRPKLAA